MLGAISPAKTLLGIPIYSLLIVTGIVMAISLASKEEKRLSLPKDTIIDLALWVVPAGIIGARLYYVAFEWDQFKDDLLSILYVWEGGIAIYGGLLGGLIAAAIFAKVRKIQFASLLDMAFPGVILAQAIGRWGNYFNMEAYGETVTNTAFQFFPFAVMIPHGEAFTWHLATFFYESLWNFCSFILLWRMRKRTHRPGDVALWYVLLYGSGRAFIEGLRTDSLYLSEGLRISQALSLLACLCAALLLYTRSMRCHRTDRRALTLAFWPCLAGIVALMLSSTELSFHWLIIPSLTVAGCTLSLIKCKSPSSIGLFTLAALQIISVCFKTALDPLLYKTIQVAICGLYFPVCSAFLYPYTRKEVV